MKVDVAGIKVDNISKTEAIARIDEFVKSGQPHYAVTPYSEIIVFALNDPNYKKIINEADLSLPDGAGVMWAAKFLGAKIEERLTGRILIYDIAALAEKKGYSIGLVGGKNNVAKIAAEKLLQLYPKLRINLTLSDRAFDSNIVTEIKTSNSDILFVAYSPPKQETWIAENYQNLGSKAVFGLGGTFDYLAGIVPVAPHFMHQIGLEWLWRLVTQPWRAKRMWNAVPVFIWKILIYKFYGPNS